jgi:hypothetical protein
MLPKFYLIIFLLPFLCYSQESKYILPHGTCIIGFVKKDSIWLGADSRVKTKTANNKIEYNSVCKIDAYNNVFIACAGSPNLIYNQKIIWDAYAKIKEEIKANNSLEDVYKIVKEKLRNDIRNIVNQFIKVRSSAETDSIFAHPAFLEPIITGFNQDNTPFLAHWFYYISGNKDSFNIVVYEREMVNCMGHYYDLKDETVMSFAGKHDSIDHFLAIHKDFFKNLKQSNESRIEYLIGLEHKLAKKDVGGDTNIVLITPHKHHWLTNRKICNSVDKN